MTPQEARDKAAHEIAHESPKYSGYPAHLETALAAWTACEAHLAQSVREFDEKNAHKYAREHWLNPAAVVEAMKWQFDQCRARIARAERDAHEDTIKALTAKIAELEARLALDKPCTCGSGQAGVPISHFGKCLHCGGMRR